MFFASVVAAVCHALSNSLRTASALFAATTLSNKVLVFNIKALYASIFFFAAVLAATSISFTRASCASFLATSAYALNAFIILPFTCCSNKLVSGGGGGGGLGVGDGLGDGNGLGDGSGLGDGNGSSINLGFSTKVFTRLKLLYKIAEISLVLVLVK